MQQRTLGARGPEVSLAGLGCSNFGWRMSEDASRPVVHKALDLGVTFFDTADSYGSDGGAETCLGRLLGPRRKDVVLATKYGNRVPTAADRAAVDDAVRRTDIAVLLDRRTDELSGGEWQRVRVARALAQGAGALVLDEPNSYLDIAHEMALFELLDGVARAGTAVLLISHQLNLVARFASRIVLLASGRVVADGSPSDVMQGDRLEAAYGWPVVVTRDPAVGAPVLVPLRRRAPR